MASGSCFGTYLIILSAVGLKPVVECIQSRGTTMPAIGHLRIVAENWLPWISITEDPETGTKIWSGVMMEVLGHLSEKLNFTYDLKQPPDHKWGGKEANGSWNGMVGMLAYK